MLTRASDLRMLDVVNVVDGRRLGRICDLDIDIDTGEVRALLLPAPGGFFSRRSEVSIPWTAVVKIGIDVIFIDVPESIDPGYARR